MQLVQDVSQELLRGYIGGQIVITNSASGTGTSFVRGTLLDVRVLNDEWLSAKLTCDEFATSVLNDGDVVWHASGGSETYVLIYATSYQDDEGMLHFNRKTPQGTTASIAPAATSTEQAA